MTKTQVLKALKNIIDPEIGIDIVNLGLIYSIDINKKNNSIKVLMTLTSPLCPFNNYLLDQVKQELLKLKFKKIDIELTFNPLWTPQRLKVKKKK
ncbi:MAG: metal-sulfur cluster assembly factor [Parcubacteria group bacterium]|nr:metal-sulfur cluster assembly factor [Parcubacteria group bacterium]